MSEGKSTAPVIGRPPAVPGFFSGVGIILQMQLRRIVRGKKLRLGLIATALIVVAVTAAQYSSVGDSSGLDIEYASARAEGAMLEGIRWGFFNLLLFLLPFLFTSTAIGEEVEGRTFVYLSSRPVGRVSITIGKWLAGTVVSVAIIASAMLLLHILCYATEPTALVEAFPQTLRAVLAASLLASTYCAICLCFGAVAPDAPGVLAALYLGVIEFSMSFLPSFFRLISLNYSAQQMAGLAKQGMMVDSAPDVSMPIAAAVLILAGTVFLGFSALVVQMSEYRFSQS